METCADPHRYFFWHIVLRWRLWNLTLLLDQDVGILRSPLCWVWPRLRLISFLPIKFCWTPQLIFFPLVRSWISMSNMISIGSTLPLLGVIPRVVCDLIWPSMLSIFLLFKMVLLFALPILTGVGIMHYGSLWALLGLVLIVSGLELTTIWIRLIDYASYALWWRLRLRFTSYFVVLFTMRLEGDFIAFSETVLLSQCSSVILISDV